MQTKLNIFEIQYGYLGVANPVLTIYTNGGRETIAEIEGIKPLAISELTQLDYNFRAMVIRELVPSLKTELRKVVFEEDKNQKSKFSQHSFADQ